MRRGLLLGLMLLATACTAANGGGGAKTAGCVPGEPREASPAGLEQVELCIESADKTRSFTVEIAASPAQQSRGLMFRTELADDKGMIFPLAQTRMASFWMKNTVIPLDIIFILPDGRIENIVENTIPYSLDPVESTAQVAAVLELRGGLTSELGIQAGDKVRWK
jgi:uncharacterized membrane protein (UPF0127 family)